MSHRRSDAVSTVAVAATALLALGAVSAEARVPMVPLVLLVVAAAALRRWRGAPAVALLGWLTLLAFTHQPYGQLQVRGTRPVEGLCWCVATAVVAGGLGALRSRGRVRGCVACALDIAPVTSSGAPARARTPASPGR